MASEPRSGAPSPPSRRTQAERRSATREKLLGATIAVLEELGYANTTTTAICAHAGVSQGALFKHFPRKSDLVAAAAEALFEELIQDYRRAFRRIEEETDASSESTTALLWEAFRSPRVLAAFDLYTAARTDPDLARAIGPVVARQGENLMQAAHELYPGFEGDLEFDALTALTLFALEGAAVNALAHRNDAGMALVLGYLSKLGREKLERGRS